MIGMLITPTRANIDAERMPRVWSSNALISAIWPRYRNSKINMEVRRASQTHQVPHMGLPHSDPVSSAKKVKAAPTGEVALAARSARGCFQIKPTALATATAT